MVFTLAILALLGLPLLSWQSSEADISATVDIDPDTLNLQIHRRWITVYIELPAGYDVNDINIDTVSLWIDTGTLGASGWDVQDDELMLKFDAELVIGLIWLEIDHMGAHTIMPYENVPVELVVTGELDNGLTFEGSDEIRVIAPSL